MSEHVQNCHVDYLAFTVRAGDMEIEDVRNHVLFLIRRIFGSISVDDTGKGWRGYTNCFKFASGALVAFGGELNNNTIHFDIPGESCSMIANWNELADFLDDYPAKLTRFDAAHDDFHGETLSIDWARDQYSVGGFKPSRGISPKSSLISDEGHGTGCTYYVGSRESGKMCRIYEKGKQLGDPSSSWVRFEVEWRAVHRELTTDMLRDPSKYLSGSYPCASFISGRISSIKTIAFKAAASIEKAIDHATKQAGGLIAALRELGHSTEEIFAKIAKPLPSPRLLASITAIKAFKEVEKPVRAPYWWREPDSDDLERIDKALSLDLSFWRSKWFNQSPNFLIGA